MESQKKNLRAAILLMFCACLFSVLALADVYAQNPFTGTFIAESKPSGAMYLALIQTQNSLSGSLTVIEPDLKDGSRSQTFSLKGSADGDVISLTSNNLSLHGRKEDTHILLMFPNASGQIATVTFRPGSEAEFNYLVGLARKSNSETLQKTQETNQLKEAETVKLSGLADALRQDVESIKNTRIQSDLDDIAIAIKDQEAAVRTLETQLTEVKHDATVQPMTCDQAYRKIGWDVNNKLGYEYAQTLGYAHKQYKGAVDQLEKRLERAVSVVEKIKNESRQLDQAMKTHQFPLPKLAIIPGSENAEVERYQALMNTARQELPKFKTKTEAAVARAKEIIAEAKAIGKKAQSMVICR